MICFNFYIRLHIHSVCVYINNILYTISREREREQKQETSECLCSGLHLGSCSDGGVFPDIGWDSYSPWQLQCKAKQPMQWIKPWQLRLRKVSISRFKQRRLVEDGSHEIQDDQVVDPAPPKIQPVLLEFWPPADKYAEKMISASPGNDFVALGQWLKQPRNPNEANKDGKTPLFYATEQTYSTYATVIGGRSKKQTSLSLPKGGRHRLIQFATGTSTTPRFRIENGAAKDQGANDVANTLVACCNTLAACSWNGHLDIVYFLVAVGAAIVIKLTRLVQLPFLCSSQYRTFFATFMTELHLLRCWS